MAINIKNRAAAAQARVAAFVEQACDELSAEVKADFISMQYAQSARWDALKKELFPRSIGASIY